MDVKGSENGIF